MIVYVLFVQKKICFEEKSLYYPHKKTVLVVFLDGVFWVFLGGFYYCQPCFQQSLYSTQGYTLSQD
jgi:hypothetical protein